MKAADCIYIQHQHRQITTWCPLIFGGHHFKPLSGGFRVSTAPFKAQVIEECAQSGASVAGVALTLGLNANLVHKWTNEQTGRCVRRNDRKW